MSSARPGQRDDRTRHAYPASMVQQERPLRIAFLDSWLQQVVDGSGTAAAIGGLGQALARRGHRVTRLAPTANWPQNLTLRRLFYNLQLPALLRTLHYDLIVGFDIDGFRWSCRAGPTPYICSVKGVIAEELQHERGMIRRMLWGLSQLERINARHAPLVISTSDYCRQMIHKHYGVPTSRMQIVPEGIDLCRWQNASAQVDRSRDPFTVLCVARQYPRKRIVDLLHAFAQVCRHIPRARLVVIGDGPEHNRLRTLAHALHLDDHVTFLGGLPDDEVNMWYRQSAIFCLPSIQEGFGIVFLEAMASGLPIVSTTAAAIPEVVPQRQAGILVPPATPNALAAALIELLADPALQTAYGDFGHMYVRKFDWDNVAARFLNVASDGF